MDEKQTEKRYDAATTHSVPIMQERRIQEVSPSLGDLAIKLAAGPGNVLGKRILASEEDPTEPLRLNVARTETQSCDTDLPLKMCVTDQQTDPGSPADCQKQNGNADGTATDAMDARPTFANTLESIGERTIKKTAPESCQVLLQIPVRVSPMDRLTGYLEQVFGEHAGEIGQVQQTESGTEVICKYPSRKQAKKAVEMAGRAFDQTQIKANLLTETGLEMTEQELSDYREAQIEAVMSKAQDALCSHEEKIKKINAAVSWMKVKKHVSLENYSKTEDLQQKLAELERQKNEFQICVQSLRAELDRLTTTDKVKLAASDIRWQFALELHKLRLALPIYAWKTSILQTIESSQVSIILGEAGSGKSTQTTQFLCQTDLVRRGMIVCTQPRKVAAVSLAQHVAKEMGSHVGGLVGYKVGMGVKQCLDTRVLYVTNNVLLNECLVDPLLTKYSCVVIDEAHERSIYCDLLLGIIKKALTGRKDLRVVVMSATIDPEVFVRYFGNGTPVVKVSGRPFPVDVHYKEAKEEADETGDYLEEAVEKAVYVHRTEGAGDILAFLTTPLETQKAAQRFQSRCSDGNAVCMPLHGCLQADEQQKVFETVQEAKRKVIFATNVAETSVTIPGVKFVIDTGFAKEMVYDPKLKMNSLKVGLISQSAAEQRKGRAGRMDSGTCYRLYTEEDFMTMDPSSKPEILRSHLGQALLKLMELGIIDPLSFDFVESPPTESMLLAVKCLEELGAVRDGRITDIGLKMAKLPLEPRLAKLVLRGHEEDIGFNTLVVATIFSAGANIFHRAGTDAEKKKANDLKYRFCHQLGDVFTFLNVYKEWHKVEERSKSQWCVDQYINAKIMRHSRENLQEVRKILTEELDLKIEYGFVDTKEADLCLRKLLLECYVANLCLYAGHTRLGYIPVMGELHSGIPLHPSSALNLLGLIPQWIVFEQVLSTSREFILNVTTLEDSEVVQELGADRREVILVEASSHLFKPMAVTGVGPTVVRRLVGPRGAGIREIEEVLRGSESGRGRGESLVVDTFSTRDDGIVTVYSHPSQHRRALSIVKDKIQEYKREITRETKEYPLLDSSPVRCVLQKGMATRTILMPNDFRTLLVKEVPQSCDNEDLLAAFRKFGEMDVTNIPSERGNPDQVLSGKVTYSHWKSAADAFKAWQDKDPHFPEGLKVQPEGIHQEQPAWLNTRVCVKWCRRPAKDFGFLTFSSSEEAIEVLQSPGRYMVRGQLLLFSKSKTSICELFMCHLAREASGEDVKEALTRNGMNPIKVVIVRENVCETSNNDLDRFTKQIREMIEALPEVRHEFDIRLEKPSKKNIECRGNISFKNLNDAHIAVAALDNVAVIDDMHLRLTLQLQVKTIIPQRVYAVLKQTVDRFCKDAAKVWEGKVRLDARELTNGMFAVNIDAESVKSFVEVKTQLDSLVGSSTLEVKPGYLFDRIAGVRGREFLNQVMQDKQVVIITEGHSLKLKIFGAEQAREEAQLLVEEHVDALKAVVVKDIALAGSRKPPGLAKYLIEQYGLELDGLLRESGVDHIVLMLGRQLLSVCGSDEAVDNVLAVVDQASDVLAQERANDRPATAAQEVICPICICPVSASRVLLESCAHAYCKPCITDLFNNAIGSKDIPIVCAQDGCTEPVVLLDVRNLFSESILAPLVSASVDIFVSASQGRYKYCITADCRMVYRASADGTLFHCPACRQSICTTCHEASHESLTCEEYQELKRDKSLGLQAWMDKDSRSRSRCPGCRAPIEKAGGCNHVHCTTCKTHICWQCKRTFKSSIECYDHMPVCGGIFPDGLRE